MTSPPERRPLLRRDTWIAAGIGLSLLSSTTAIALWVFAPPRSATVPEPAPSASTPLGVPPAPPRRASLATPGKSTNSRAPRGDNTADPAPRWLPADVRVPSRRAAAPASPSVLALADRLHLNADVLVAQLGDPQGEIPKAAADRLQRAYDAADALAVRLGLDEGRTQSLSTLYTSHAFSVLAEERRSAPDPLDPERREQIEEATLDAIRATCDEDTATLAEAEIASL